MMKRTTIAAAIAAAAAILSLPQKAKADEGMWMLPLLEKMNIATMQEMGCRLSADQIYSANHSSLKDAIVQFGGGCTAEIVSDQGLLLTNHHCGYASIQQLSTVEHDYLAQGYWAMNRSEELPVPGLSVKFMESITDITDMLAKVEKKARKEFKDSTDIEKKVAEARATAINELLEKTEQGQPNCSATVLPFYDTNVWYLIIYKEYKDIRFVGAPPSSIGKFGADTDNWTWPRHTGDFSVFRVYAGKDNEPATYSPDNQPYAPKQHLSISLKGHQEGDFTMIMGYPGRTTRFQSSVELENQLLVNDIRIAARTTRQDVMRADMQADPKIRLQYSAKYAQSSNGWKKWQGMKLAFKKLNVIGRAEQKEESFKAWVEGSKGRTKLYGRALEDIAVGTMKAQAANLQYTLATETIYRIELQQMAVLLKRDFNAMLPGSDSTAALKAAYDALLPMYKDYSVGTDRKIAKAMIDFYQDNVTDEYAGSDGGMNFKTMNVDAYVDSLFDTSAFTSEQKLLKAIESGTVFSDPAYKLAEGVKEAIVVTYDQTSQCAPMVADGRKAFTAGLMEWKKGEPSYPDANFTMRLTYGSVKSYSPRDAVIYRHYTTLDGVMEKEDPNSWEFTVPQKLKDLYQAGDFGPYALPDGKMPVAFLSNNDITGGNSGSPILNAEGQLLGLAFDGNWESMSSDVMFEPEYQRCINVDIRYVLFIIDKFGGAGWLLEEMDIVR